MGLLDVLNGMQQGPRGPSSPRDPSAQSGGGMSPMTMAILGLIAWKAVKHLTGGAAGASPASSPGNPAPSPASRVSAGESEGGDIGSVLMNGLGGLLAGGTAGSVLSGGLGDLLKQFQQSGQGDAADSWVGPGPNKQVSPNDLGRALGADQINSLASQSGMSRDELLSGLSKYLPQVIDHLTPDGRMPTDKELSGRL